MSFNIYVPIAMNTVTVKSFDYILPIYSSALVFQVGTLRVLLARWPTVHIEIPQQIFRCSIQPEAS